MHKSSEEDYCRLRVFKELLPCIGNLYCRAYDVSWNPPSDISSEERLFYQFFTSCIFPERIKEYAHTHDTPYAVGTYSGLTWYAVLEKSRGELVRIYLLGPVLHAALDTNEMENFLKEYEKKGMNFHSRHLFVKAMQTLPVLFHSQFDQLALMLHFCVNGEYLSSDALNSLVDSQLDELVATTPVLYQDIYSRLKGITESLRAGISLSEMENPDLPRSMLPTNAARIHAPLRQWKDTLIILAFQFANAAIEGGVPAELAYALADKYIHSAESERSAMELTAMCKSLYADFQGLVQKAQAKNRQYSVEIETCILYINQHPEEDLSLPALAALVGYGAYYLSRKFKAETGTSLPAYIRQQKIRYGAMLLTATNEETGEIAKRLHFSSYSHFSTVFHDIMGMPPSEYRAAKMDFIKVNSKL